MPDDDIRFEGRSFLLVRDDPADTGAEPLPPQHPGWLSPDIVVRKPDMTRGGEAEGGALNHVEVTVHNRGGVEAIDTEVSAWVCGPTIGWTPATAHPVGTGFADVPGYGSASVALPWTPSSAQHGHVCLIARAAAPSTADVPRNLGAFEVREDRHVAQRNIHVVDMAAGGEQQVRALVVDPEERGGRFRLTATERRFRRPDDLARALDLPFAARAARRLAAPRLGLRPLERFDPGRDMGLLGAGEPQDGFEPVDDAIELEGGRPALVAIDLERARSRTRTGTVHVVEVALHRDGSETAAGGLWIVVRT